MKDRPRCCAKCGTSTSKSSLVLHRFPKPGSWNVRRIEEWAKFCYPEMEWSSSEFHKVLYSSHKMLCSEHFAQSAFINYSEGKLHRFAIPGQKDPEPSTSQHPTHSTAAQEVATVGPAATPESGMLLTASPLDDDAGDDCGGNGDHVDHSAVETDCGAGGAVRHPTPTPAEEAATAATATKPKSKTNSIKSMNIPVDNEYVLLFDEISITKNLNYNWKMDLIEGFQDLGETQGRDAQIASHALVFMVVGILRKYEQPVASYLSSNSVTGDTLSVFIKEVLEKCLEAGINIAATVCDIIEVNRRALFVLGATEYHPFFMFGQHEIVALFDPPHLLKCFRNLFMKYNIKFGVGVTNEGHPIFDIAKWSHIKQFYAADHNDPFFVFAPALTKDHLDPNDEQKMDIELAAQVVSHAVSAGMYAKISQGELPPEANGTLNLLSKMSKLFDALNANSPDVKNSKVFSTNLSDRSLHLKFFTEMIPFIKKMEFIGIRQKPPSQDGWVQTLLGVQRLWKNLKKKYPYMIKSLATRLLQQEPLKNYCIECARNNCGSNVNPTAQQLAAGLETAITSNLSHDSKGTNCEEQPHSTETDPLMTNSSSRSDVTKLNNLDILEGQKRDCANVCVAADTDPLDQLETTSLSGSDVTELENFDIPDCEKRAYAFVCGAADTDPSVMSSSDVVTKLKNFDIPQGEKQACAFVCGYILKSIKNSCTRCFDAMKEDVECTNDSLSYCNEEMLMCAESCSKTIDDHLRSSAHELGIRTRIIGVLKEQVNFEFLYECPKHYEKNVIEIISSLFYVNVNRYCVTKNISFTEEAPSSSSLKRKRTDIKKQISNPRSAAARRRRHPLEARVSDYRINILRRRLQI